MKICTHDDVLRAGRMTMNGTPAGHLRMEEPAIRMRKGDKVVIKASHGIGHLMNSIYSERVPGAKRGRLAAKEAERVAPSKK
jgi:2-keto-4-pentenoate hydratase/2-oxohepta-3-ene-1,7-dioic acid hydratase in catechol pathway